MNKNFLVAAFIAMGTMSTTANAHEVPYGPAGCGLGSMVLGNEAGIEQVVAMTLNMITGNQSLGITLGTLNCDVGGGSAGAALFIEANREAVAKDISRGGGETINTLTELGECTESAKVGETLQGSFSQIFTDESNSDHQVAERIVAVMQQNGELGCFTSEEAS